MAPLRNNRAELFCLGLAEGLPAGAAYARAGYRPHDSNCIRLRHHPTVQARLAELQAEAAKSTQITIESICAELDAANEIAKRNGQASALVSAATLRAKLAGLLETRIKSEVDVTVHVDLFADAKSVQDCYAICIRDLAGDVALSDAEMAHACDMMQDFTERLDAFITDCRYQSFNARGPWGPRRGPKAVASSIA
jgi:phage terminase small subunit